MKIFVIDFKVTNGDAFNAGNMVEHFIRNTRDEIAHSSPVGRFLPARQSLANHRRFAASDKICLSNKYDHALSF